MQTRLTYRWKPYWVLQAAGWTAFGAFYFGTRLFLSFRLDFWLQEIGRLGLALFSTFVLRWACRAAWMRRGSLRLGFLLCLLLSGLLALAGELSVELIGHAFWNDPHSIAIGLVLAESNHFFIPLICWCALYFAGKTYQHAEEQNRRTTATLLAQREAELKRLRFQVQPDFFSIALDRICSLVQDGQPTRASVMTSQFGSILHSMLEEREIRLADLASELVQVAAYLRIVLGQVDAPFEVELVSDLDTDRIIIPRWLLIPLAEIMINSPRATGRLRLSASADTFLMQLRVAGDVVVAYSDFAQTHLRLYEVFGERGDVTSTISDGHVTVELRMPLVLAIDVPEPGIDEDAVESI